MMKTPFVSEAENLKTVMKKQEPAGVTAPIPQVRYHPSIRTRAAVDGLGGGAWSGCSPQTEPEQEEAVAPAPPVRPCLGRRNHRPLKLAEGAAAALGQTSSTAPPRKPLRPEPVLLGQQLDEGLVKEVEVLTRGQRTNAEWFAWRKNRITASLAPSIVRCRFVNGKSGAPPPSYLAAIRGRPHPLHLRAQVNWVITLTVQTADGVRAPCWLVEKEAV